MINTNLEVNKNNCRTLLVALNAYKLLCAKQIQVLTAIEMPMDLILKVSEDNLELVEYVRGKLGYFISGANFFESWNSNYIDFDICNVMDATSAITRLRDEEGKYSDQLDCLEVFVTGGITSLGDTATQQRFKLMQMVHFVNKLDIECSINELYEFINIEFSL